MRPKPFAPKDIAPKIHTKKRKWRLAIEVIFIVVISIGSLFTLLRFNDISIDQIIENIGKSLRLQRQPSLVSEGVPIEERIRQLIDKKVLNIVSIEKSDKGFITIWSKERIKVILSSDSDLEVQAKTLQNVLSKAKIEGKSVSLVDFRFEKLVVRYNR